jgi:hypothetical protein
MILQKHIFGSMNTRTVFLLFFVLVFAQVGHVFAQEKYILGDEQKLEIVVHIIGEVKRPGEYQVLDGTNALELLSKAGGPTEFSNIGSVTIARVGCDYFSNDGNPGSGVNSPKRIIKVNLNDYLKKANATPPPKLQPGDVVLVPRNSWSKWRDVARIIRDVSVMVSLYLLYLRATN